MTLSLLRFARNDNPIIVFTAPVLGVKLFVRSLAIETILQIVRQVTAGRW
jgi:hypothetical protein